ncbi:MAG: signal peptidase I [Thermoleophilia bacterium]
MAENESGSGAPRGSGEHSRDDSQTPRPKHDRWVTMPPEGWDDGIGWTAPAVAEPAGKSEEAPPSSEPAWYRSDELQPAAATAGQTAGTAGPEDSRRVKPAGKTPSTPVYIIRRAFRDVIFPLAIAFAVAMFAQATVAKPYQIPSGSMLPTIQLQDRILANRMIYRFHPVQRGDVVVFTPPAGLEQDIPYVKRVIGLPGDTVEVRSGHTFVNGYDFPVPEATTPTYTRAPQTVPEGQMFVLGDNRNESSDSHIWGYVPMDNIIGRADVIYWPPHDFHLLGN